jgi:hypothetical protein
LLEQEGEETHDGERGSIGGVYILSFDWSSCAPVVDGADGQLGDSESVRLGNRLPHLLHSHVQTRIQQASDPRTGDRQPRFPARSKFSAFLRAYTG